MKVETGLRSGAATDNAAAAATQAASDAEKFFSQAGRQARNLTGQLVNKTTSVWNCLTAG